MPSSQIYLDVQWPSGVFKSSSTELKMDGLIVSYPTVVVHFQKYYLKKFPCKSKSKNAYLHQLKEILLTKYMQAITFHFAYSILDDCK